ncbi:MAG: hypothetical protein BWY93_01821 [Euryarchaeota archaeon ADurb.BinA087]|nr:MAG: hypothetical protein BWY93_01821 [Euryarchaeota archaeon ADurb.BinA087]
MIKVMQRSLKNPATVMNTGTIACHRTLWFRKCGFSPVRGRPGHQAGGELPAGILECSILSPLKITASLMGDFDPRKHTAEERGIDAKGDYVRGLKMSETRFKNMVTGHSPAEQQSMRQQVEEAEAKGLRTYQIKHAKGYYNIENGIVIGSAKGK